MAEALIVPAVDLMLSHLISGIGKNINLIMGFEKELGRLKDEVEMIQDVLHDAERRSLEEAAVKRWLKKLADFASTATDVLDEFAYHGLRRKVEKVSPKPSFLSKRKMGKKIKKLLASLEKINKQASDYRLQREGGHAPPLQVPEGRETTSLIDVSEEVVGREDDIAKIMQMLTSESNQQTLSVLPIVGMGGQGKTTLAKQIYNNDGVKSHFQKRMWVCVSDEFNVKRLLKSILESLMGTKYELDTKEEMLKELHKRLGGEKYLLVLDDVWNEDPIKWEVFTSDLRSANTSKGNNIVVTTRSTRVGKLVGTFEQPYSLKELSDDDCWYIFSTRAFPNGVLGGFQFMGEEIVKKCRGLPLAAKVVGSMLRHKKELHEWRSIAKSGVWNSVGDDTRVLQILKLSYDNLSPSSLKHCFSYCSIFRKDSVMKKDELIQLWMTLGYLRPQEQHNNMEIEDIGTMYFNILVEKSLLQDITTNFYGNVESCKMHDLVHDLAQFVSTPNVFNVEGGKQLASENIPHIRHLALYSDRLSLDTIGQQVGDKLHTLFLSNIEIGKGFMDFKCLQVLKLHGSHKLPTSISTLIHLRYIDWSIMFGFNVLPDSITKLYHLQTLRLSYVKYFPDEMRNLISLRHLYFKTYNLVKMPPKLGSLTCLQTLPLFIVGEEKGHQVEELGSLKNLGGKLKISNLEKVKSKEDAESANLLRKSKIDKLKFVWNWEEEHGCNIDHDVLEGLQPHCNLKSLCLVGFAGDSFPDWVMNMSVNVGGSQLLFENLVDIKLSECNRVEGIPTLGHLPFLRRLRLEGMRKIKCIGESFYGYNDSSSSRKSSRETITLFPALEEFVLDNMEDLEEWMGATTSQEDVVVFPRLNKLIVYNCEKLKTSPNHFPCVKVLRFERVNGGSIISICSNNKLTTLSHLSIRYVSDLISLPDELLHNNRHHLMNLSIFYCHHLKLIPSLEGLKSLTSMMVSKCQMLESLPQDLQSCTSLRSLTVMDCGKLKSIPSLKGLKYLTTLVILNCEMLESLPQDLQSCTSLRNLAVQYCRNLKSIPSLEGLKSLTTLDVYNCKMLERLTGGLQSCTSLRSLTVKNCCSLKSIPSLEGLKSLTTLDCSSCEMLESLPRGLQSCTSLNKLAVGNCNNLNLMASVEDTTGCLKVTHLPLNLSSLSRLETLSIGGTTSSLAMDLFKGTQYLRQWVSLRTLTLVGQPECDTLPKQLQYLTALTSITLRHFGVEALPDWFGKLECLEEIHLWHMEKLKYLPSSEAMLKLTKLRQLYINICPMLEARCKEGDRPEWSKISAISDVSFI